MKTKEVETGTNES